MNKDNKAILSIDIGGSKIMIGIISSNKEVIYKEKLVLNSTVNPDNLIRIILGLAKKVIKKYDSVKFKCIGVTIPGLADVNNGIWVYAPFSGIRNFKIADILSNELKLPVFVENDVNACAYGEKMYGNCKTIQNFLWITISNGVGGGLILNNELYRGAFNNAAEIGHINVVEDGYKCRCGNNGCLEAYAAGPGIVRRYLERVENKIDVNITAKIVAEKARKGDEIAKNIYEESGYYLGKAISYVVNIINPQKIILGGGISMDMDLFMPILKKTLDKMIFKEANSNIIIEKTELGYDAALIGAGAIAEKGMMK